MVLLVGIGGGGLYIATRPSGPLSPPALPVNATLSAEPATVEQGQSVTLRWSTENATDLDLEPGVGKVQATGSTSVTPQDTTTYTLTASGPGGTQSPTANVTVTTPPPAPQPPPQNPEVNNPQLTPAPTRETHKTKAARRTEAPAPAPPQIDAKAVQGKITLGKFLAKNGQYDESIATFRQGLQLDPSNAELQRLLGETIKACQAEDKTLGENNKCGGP
jgi:hypothetical protein